MSDIHTISAYLLKSTIKEPKDAFKKRAEIGELRSHRVDAGETTGTLFVQAGAPKQPSWVDFLSGYTKPAIKDKTRRLNAVLVLEAAGRRFAITFGSTARFLLATDSYERGFGLRCALNTVDPEQLRSAQGHTLTGNPLYIARQLTYLDEFATLEFDTERELLDALGGRLADQKIGNRVDGRDSVRLTAALDPPQLREKCAELLAASKRTDYREHFRFVDQIKWVKDRRTIKRLEKKALKALGERHGLDEFDLFPPQLVGEEIVEFKIRPAVDGMERIVEPDASLLSHPLRRPQSGDKAKRALERFKIRGIDANGEVVDEWSFFKCLHWELEEEGSVYVLDGGRWYEIDRALANDVEAFVLGLESTGIDWLEARIGESEGDYNKDAAKAHDCALLDKELIKLSGRSPIEACDLFTAQGHFVHVKHRKGGSGPLSHLYAQAIVSAECFVSMPEYRDLLAKKLEEVKKGYGQYSPDVVDTADYGVVLALIATPAAAMRGDVAKKLPFFSKVMLRVAVRQLRAMGFTVYLDVIPTVRRRKRKGAPPAAKPAKKAKATAKARSAAPAGKT